MFTGKQTVIDHHTFLMSEKNDGNLKTEKISRHEAPVMNEWLSCDWLMDITN